MDVNLVNNPDSISAFANHLAASGLYALANALSKKSSPQFECAWRLGDWNVLNQMNATETNDFQQVFEKQHYVALKCLQTTRDEKGVKDALKTARYAIISFLKHLSLECTDNIYQHLKRLTLLQQIDDFCQVNHRQNSRVNVRCQKPTIFPYVGPVRKAESKRSEHFHQMETSRRHSHQRL